MKDFILYVWMILHIILKWCFDDMPIADKLEKVFIIV
jgi:hypothetical protein